MYEPTWRRVQNPFYLWHLGFWGTSLKAKGKSKAADPCVWSVLPVPLSWQTNKHKNSTSRNLQNYRLVKYYKEALCYSCFSRWLVPFWLQNHFKTSFHNVKHTECCKANDNRHLCCFIGYFGGKVYMRRYETCSIRLLSTHLATKLTRLLWLQAYSLMLSTVFSYNVHI